MSLADKGLGLVISLLQLSLNIQAKALKVATLAADGKIDQADLDAMRQEAVDEINKLNG